MKFVQKLKFFFLFLQYYDKGLWCFGTSYWCIHRGIEADKQATQVLPFTLSIGTITLLRSTQ